MRIMRPWIIIGLAAAWISVATFAQRQYFQVRPSNVTVTQGDTVTIQCTVGNQAQQGQTHWTKDGGVLGFDDILEGFPRYRVTGDHSKGEYHLEISDARLEDDDEYECQVQPGEGETSGLRAAAYVNVQVPPTNVTLDGIGSGAILEAKKDVIFEVSCHANGAKPAADIEWYRNGNPVPKHLYQNRVVSHDKKRFSTVSSFRWTAAKDDNGAIFTCFVIHPALPVSRSLKAQFTLSVLYPPSAPVITGYDSGRILISDEFLQLKCSAENGNPPPDLVWYRNAVALGRNATTAQGITRNDYGFVVKAIDDNADYRCEASNSATLTPLSSSVRLKVYFPPEKVEIIGPNEATVGEIITLQCKSSASQPQAKIEWLIGGEPWTDHKQRNKPDSSGIGIESISSIDIKIAHTRPELTAICTSTNEHLPRSSKGEVVATNNIKVYYPPESVKITYNEEKPLVSGENILLTCTATGGYPAATLEWFRNEKRITTGATSKHGADNSAISELTLTLLEENNLEQVQCRAYNLASGSYRLTDGVVLHVQFPPSSVRISPNPEFLAGSPAELICESGSGNPSPVVDWYRDNELLPSVVAYNKTGPNGGWIVKKKLFLSPTVEDNGAVYECRARSEVLRSTAVTEKIALSVHYKPIILTSTKQTLEVLEGESISLNATSNANPPVDEYMWLKDDLPSYLLRSTPPRLFVNGPILELVNIRRSDAGLYTCKAKNKIGTSNLTALVTVKYPAEIKHISPRTYAVVGDNVTLTCDVDAYPLDTISMRWETIDGDRLSPPSRYVESSVGGRGTLTIFGVRIEDTRQYVCSADNGIGNAAAETALLVKRAPTFDEEVNPQRTAAEIGDEAVLRCNADGVPEPKIRWHREQVDDFGARTLYRMPDNERVKTTSEKFSLTRVMSEVRITNIQDTDYGTYRCVAENELGADSFDVQLTVTSEPDTPLDLRVLNYTHDSVTLTWQPGFDGGLTQYFRVCYSIGVVVSKSSASCFTSHDTVLTISNLYPGTKYAFVVDAVNEKGASVDYARTEIVETSGPANLQQDNTEEDIPVLIIILVCLVGAVLLVLNAALVVCLLRRQRRRKLQEKATNARLGNETVGRKVQMYSGSDGATGTTGASSVVPGGGSVATSRRADSHFGNVSDRPSSAISDDDTSIRTVIELDGTGQPVFSQSRSTPGQVVAPLCTNGDADCIAREFIGNPSNGTVYANATNPNSVPTTSVYPICIYNQEQHKNCIPAHVSEEMVPTAVGPLRSLSQELNNYAAFTHYSPLPSTSSTPRHQQGPRRYSPPQFGHPAVSTVVHTNGRTPYAEVRPILTSNHRSQSPSLNGQQQSDRSGGSPVLSTFSSSPRKTSNAKADYLEVDALTGDLV